MDDLKLIKKHYGENMMHLCRELFPTLIEQNILFKILSDNFDYSKFLCDDIINENKINDFKNFIFKKTKNVKIKKVKVTSSPQELLDKAGYILYECKNEKDIQSFRHYYKREDSKKLPEYIEGTKPLLYSGEELCTFNGNRLDDCYVFFAVKKNVDEIKRENFKNPERQDEYGTSVLSIQFSRGDINTLSIKNRYNHTVNNPDSTFSNDLDNIIVGLTDSFCRKYNLNIKYSDDYKFELKNYVKAEDKYYKYNYEYNNIYYCPNNIIIDNFEVKKYDKEKYVVFDGFLLDLVKKEIRDYDRYFPSSFMKFFDDRSGILYGFEPNTYKIKKIDIKINKESKTKDIIINDKIVISLNNKNSMVGYKNPLIEYIGYQFLDHSPYLKELSLPKVKTISDFFLYSNKVIEEINLPNLEKVGIAFLRDADSLKTVSLPKLKNVGDYFLQYCINLKELSLPSVKRICNNFCKNCSSLENVDLPMVEKIDDDFMLYNNAIKKISLPSVRIIGHCFLESNRVIEEVDLPKAMYIGHNFLYDSKNIEKLSLPSVLSIGLNFLFDNKSLKEIDLPSLGIVNSNFLFCNKELKKISFPNLESIADYFIPNNYENLEEVDFPLLKGVGASFLSKAQIRSASFPKLEEIGEQFMSEDRQLEELYIPKLKRKCFKFLPNIEKEKILTR